MSFKKFRANLSSWERRFFRKYASDLTDRMRQLIDDSGKSYSEVAELAGWKPSYLSRILNGESNITLQTVAKFEDAIGFELLIINDTSTSGTWWISERNSTRFGWVENGDAELIFNGDWNSGGQVQIAANDYSSTLREMSAKAA